MCVCFDTEKWVSRAGRSGQRGAPSSLIDHSEPAPHHVMLSWDFWKPTMSVELLAAAAAAGSSDKRQRQRQRIRMREFGARFGSRFGAGGAGWHKIRSDWLPYEEDVPRIPPRLHDCSSSQWFSLSRSSRKENRPGILGYARAKFG